MPVKTFVDTSNKTIAGREYDKFVDGENSSTAVNTHNVGSSLSTGSQQVTDISPAKTSFKKSLGITQLTAPGDTVEVNVENYDIFGYSFTVASIDTNVIVNLEGTIDGTNFFEVSLDSTAVVGGAYTTNRVTITANGTYHIFARNQKMAQVRFNWVSESGGTAATIDADFMAGN